MSAIGDILELGAKPANVAAYMFGQATFILKEQGYKDSEVVGIVEGVLKNYEWCASKIVVGVHIRLRLLTRLETSSEP